MATTPNMNLTIPEVLVTTGPQYATQVNEAFDEIDSHDHSTGKGARITPSGLNINAALAFNNNSLTNVKAVTLATQASVTTNKSIYSKGNDLYFRDANGIEIQLTASGSVNVAGVGGFTGLVSPASATYTLLSETFGFFSDSGEYAIVATGDLKVFSRTGASPQAVTLVADSATAAYNLQLPTAAPAESSFMRMKVGNPAVFVDLLGTNDQVVVTHNAGDTTLSLPQDIATTSTPQFAGLTLTGTANLVDTVISTTLEVQGNAEFQGDVDLTKAAPAVLDAPTYNATFATVSTNIITPRTGTDTFFTGNIQGVNLTLSDDITAQDLTLSGSVVLNGFSKTITGTFVDANLRNITASQTVTGATLTSSGSINGISATLSSFVSAPSVNTDSILPKAGPLTGVAIAGRFNGVSPAAGDIGEIQIYAPASNIVCSSSYQNLYTHSLGAGIWEVSACVSIISNNSGFLAPNVSFLQAAVSLTSAGTDDVRYARSQASVITLNFGEQIDVVTFSRRLNLSSNTDVYLVSRVFGSNVNQAFFEAARTTLKIQRVG